MTERTHHQLKHHRQNFNPKTAQRGFSLIELLISIALASMGLLAISSGVVLLLNSEKSVQTTLSRTVLRTLVQKALTNRKSLKVTILSNPVMKAAVSGTASDYAAIGGTLFTDNRAYGIEIRDSGNQILAGKGADATSTGSTPVYYTVEGLPCSTPGMGNCLIASSAVVRIQGKAEWGTTANMIPRASYPAPNPTFKPDFMMVTYKIEILAGTGSTNIQRKPFEGTAFILIDDVESLVP